MRKKQFTRIAALGLALVMLAGCGGKQETKDTAADGNKETVKEQDSGEETAKSQDNPTISIGLRAGNSYVQACPDINADEHVLAFEEKMGVDLDITLIQHDGFTEKLGMMLAQGDFPDVIAGEMPYTSVMAGAIDNGLFMPLDDLLEEYGPNLMEQVPANVWDELRGPDGHIYAIGDFMSNTARRCTAIRKDLLDELGLDVPETLDDYYNVLVAFKNAGVKYPFIGREKFKYSETFFAAYGVVPTTWQLNEDGQVVPAYILPEMKDALAFYKKLYDEGLIDAESLTNNGTVRDQKAAAGDVGMMVLNISALPGYNVALQENVPDGEWICVSSPLNPDGGKHGYAAFTPTANVHYINANCKNPEEIIKFFDKMLEPDQDYIFIMMGFFTCGFHMAIITNHLPTQILSYGYSNAETSFAFSVYGIATVLGCLASGAFCGRFRGKNVLGTLYSSRSIMVLLFFILPKSLPVICGFIFLLGFTGSATLTPVLGICRDLFGSKGAAVFFSFAFFIHQIGGFCAAWFAGECFAALGSYTVIWTADVLLAGIAGIVSYMIRVRALL